VKAIGIKLFRDLWYLRGQAVAIAMVIASGIATYVMSASTLTSLQDTRARFYSEYQFADVFASLKRAPTALEQRLQSIPGVSVVEVRVVAPVNLRVTGYQNPVRGQLVSLPESGVSQLNQLYLREGRLPLPYADREVVISEAFAEAHDFHPGDSIGVIINGALEQMSIVGLVLSPEFIYQIKPGSVFPDFARYGILWMSRHGLSVAYDMEGAFNNVAVRLTRGSQPQAVIERLDSLLEPYGALGAYARKDQLSHRYLDSEFMQLESMATLFPIIFLGVAAFLLNVVVTRLINTQRDQIAILKAFGYDNITVGLHYLAMVSIIVAIGTAVGVLGGIWLGQGLANLYMGFFRFPFLEFVIEPKVLLIALLVSLASAFVGTVHSLRMATRLPPAEAMRPEPPADFRETLIERLGLQRWLSQPSRMIIRHLGRTPGKTGLAILGIALASGILMVGKFQEDSINYMVAIQFGLAQRNDMSVVMNEATSSAALYELASIPGIEIAEGLRYVPVRLHHGHHSYRTGITGFDPDSTLRTILDVDLKPLQLPAEGLILTDYLARMLKLEIGDVVVAEVLEGTRPTLELPVVGLVKEFMGVGAYTHIDFINHAMDEGNVINGAWLAVDPAMDESVYRALDERPGVAGVNVRKLGIKNFYDTMAKTLLTFTLVSTLLAATIAFGVVYNSARIALSERSRELASLRVLGYTQGEVAYILLGELAVLTVCAIPVGFVVGRALCAYMASNLESDLYRVPLILEPGTYSFAASVIIVSAFVSGLIIKFKLNRLDLIEVLKTRE
jgi:putative ABC transport system permease protein